MIRGLCLLFLSLCTHALQAQDFSRASTYLHTGWEYRQLGRTDEWRPTRVPGSVHLDLVKDGVIPDPYVGKNEKDLGWIEYASWEYRTTFRVGSEIKNKQHKELVFEGLDTYATVYLNGAPILEADNMFRTWKVPVTNKLSDAENVLSIVFHSPQMKGFERRSKFPDFYPNVNEQTPKASHTSTYTRKAPYHYGWDWGPRLVTSGVYKPIKLVGYTEIDVEDLFWKPETVTAAQAKGEVQATIRMLNKATVKLKATIGASLVASKELTLDTGVHTVVMPVVYKAPKLWWPNGLGAQPLYDLKLEATTNNEMGATKTVTMGFCSIKHIQKPDAKGRSFSFEVNGSPVFMKGTNYLPPDHFTTRVDSADYARIINWCKESNMNMIRVWGGSVYADDWFYKLAAKAGIVVWNEFMFACSAYPGDDDFVNSIRAEATDNIKRVRNWPNIGIWSGNNENMNGVRGWFKNKYKSGESDSLLIEAAFNRIFYKELRERMATLAPHISYWPTSPQSKDLELENDREGDRHYWGVYFGKEPFSSFYDKSGRFVSEYGIQSFPAMSTFKRVEKSEDLYLGSAALKHRQRSPLWLEGRQQSGNEGILWYISKYYKTAEGLEHNIYLSQLMQAYCLKTAIEAHRSMMATCGGTMFWQINDTWPCTSWSTVDYYGTWKAAQYQVKDHYRTFLPVVDAGSKGIEVKVASDALKPTKLELRIRIQDFSGEVLYTTKKMLDVAPHAAKTYFLLGKREMPANMDKFSAAMVIELYQGKNMVGKNIHYFAEPKDLKIPRPFFDRVVNPVDGGYEVTIKARNLLKNVYFYTRQGTGHFGQNFMDLMPGESITVKLKVDKALDNFQEDIRMMTLWDTLPKEAE